MSELSEALTQLLNQLVAELKANIPNATGETSASLEVQVQDKNNNLFTGVSGKILADKHFFVLETGRRPGKMPPIESIKKWVEAKGFSFPIVTSAGNKIKTAEGLSWAIAIKISKEGSKLFRQGGHSGVISNVLTDSRLDNFAQVFNSELSRVILNNVLTKFQTR